jgi:hypothetical protein
MARENFRRQICMTRGGGKKAKEAAHDTLKAGGGACRRDLNSLEIVQPNRSVKRE